MPVSFYLGPPRSANAVILRGERRSSGELNAPVRFGLISLLRRCLLVRHLMPAYILFVVSGYNPDVYFCSVRESSGSRLFFIIFRRLSIGSHVVHCPACHAVINYIPSKERKLLFILHFCRIFAATLPPAGTYLWRRPAKTVPFELYCSRGRAFALCPVLRPSGPRSQYVFFSASKRGGVLSSIPRDRIPQ